jgi:hypothetical protein
LADQAMAVAEAPQLCECGCGGQPKTPRARFLPGHHMRLVTWRDPSHRPVCRYCGRQACNSTPSFKGSLKSYDPETDSYVCNTCQDGRARVKGVRCRRCGTRRDFILSRIRETKSYDPQSNTWLCGRCQAHDAVRGARAELLARYSIGPADSPDSRLAAMQDHAARTIGSAGARARREQRLAATQARRMTEEGRHRLSIHRLLAARRLGLFRLCPSCQKLVYVSRYHLLKGRPGFHGNCYREFERTPQYKLWRQHIGNLRSPTVRLRLKRYPHPLPPRPPGRPPTPEQLEERFCWLLRHYLLRESWAEIAHRGGYERSAIAKGVASLLAILPDSWSEVFGGKEIGRRLDDLLPMDRLRP